MNGAPPTESGMEHAVPIIKGMVDEALKSPGCRARLDQLARIRRLRGQLFSDPAQAQRLWPVEVFVPSPIVAICGHLDSAARQSTDGRRFSESVAQSADVEAIRTDLAFAAWRDGKGIYRFHPSLVDELVKTPVDHELPVEVLKRLPEYGAYLHVDATDDPPDFAEQLGEFGFIAFYDMVDHDIADVPETESSVESLVLLPLIDARGKSPLAREVAMAAFGEVICIPLLPGRTLRQCIEIGLGTASGPSDAAASMAAAMIAMTMYLCAEEPDVRGRSDVDAVWTGGKHRIGASQIRQWDVGWRIAAQLREARKQQAETLGTGTGNRPRPHLRRAHWHGYWCGSHHSSDRQLRMKWLAPVLVNTQSAEDVIPTLRDVGGAATSLHAN